MRFKLLFILTTLPYFVYSQYYCDMVKNNEADILKNGLCFQISNNPDDYSRRYDLYRDIYENRNEIIIPIDFFIWQKDDGTENYIDNH